MRKELLSIIIVVLFGIITLVSVIKRDRDANYKTILSSRVYGHCSNALIEDGYLSDDDYISISSSHEFGYSWDLSGDRVDYKNRKGLRFEFDLDSQDTSKALILVFTCMNDVDSKYIFYHGVDFKDKDASKGFTHVESTYMFDEKTLGLINESCDFTVYFWNKDRSNFKVKDFSFTSI